MRITNRARHLALSFFLLSGFIHAQNVEANKNRNQDERLSFQTGGPWSPRTNLNADVAMVYGIAPSMPATLRTWQEHGYHVQLMTGVAWGEYQDYLNGQFDGKNHWDQAQKNHDGNLVLHGGNKAIPYISPGDAYGHYLTTGIQRALDAGAEALYLEEPEFWASSGWEENFKHEWKAYYGEDWAAPDSSPDAQYRASKLKYYLYRRTLAQIFEFAKEYGKAHGRAIPCYVPTHSLINYANWRIVSPESSLIEVGADGYIAQVWTGTARTPNYYNGLSNERTFETAFLEYGAMQNLVRASGRRVWYLNDPIEDDPNHDWEDYRTNWESTLTASLMQSEVWRFEIMPWPDRVFNSKHPARSVVENQNSAKAPREIPVGTGLSGFAPEADVEKVGIPKAYETELQAVIGALGDMKQADTRWQVAGTQNVGILISDTMMFERAAPTPSDAYLGSFFGLAMPLLKSGIPVEPVQIESATSPGFLDRYKMLLLTYEGQKPPTPAFHSALAAWVRNGGALVVVDQDGDPYNAVREWWNTAPNAFQAPRQHLFTLLGLEQNAAGVIPVGRGVLVSARVSPAALSHDPRGGEIVRKLAQQAASAVNLPWRETNSMVLRRGPYVIAVGLSESFPNATPQVLRGHFIDLFDARQPLLTHLTLSPGARRLLVDLDQGAGLEKPRIVAAACAVKDIQASKAELKFYAEGIANTHAVVTISASSKPKTIRIDGKEIEQDQVDFKNGVLRLSFDNSPAGFPVDILF